MTIAEAMQQAVEHFQANRFGQAEEMFRAILAQQPDNPYALNYMGLVLKQRGQVQEAATVMRRSIANNPPVAHFYTNLAGVLMSMGDFPGAEAAARSGLQHDPNLAQGHLDLGNALWSQGRHEEAIAEFRRGIELDPKRWDIYTSLGLCLHDMGRPAEGVEALQKAVEIDPQQAGSLANLGTVQISAHQVEQGVENCRRAVSLMPYQPGFHMNLALALLTAGDWAAGWQEYEWRAQITEINPNPRIYAQPKWDGSSLDGRTILLYTENNISDSLTFARYVSLIAQGGGKVVVECAPEMAELFLSLKGVTQVIRPGDLLPHFDVHYSLSSLPMHFGTTPANVPAEIPYLAAPESKREASGKHIEQQAGDAKLRVGVSWAKAPSPAQQPRIATLQVMSPLGDVQRVRWYNLGPSSSARQTLNGVEMVDLFPSFRDFADVAAAIANLDLVIAADTPVAHVAGAMGKEVWTILPYAAEWRWLLDREDTPWYPTMRLFRQPAPGDWATVSARITDALRARVGT